MPGGKDPAFAKAGQKHGLEVWRVKDFRLLPVEQRDHGTFYSGDSYIVLNTFGDPKRPSWDVHMWLGNETSQDESGTAAIKMVELDDCLGGFPVQHREVQGHESPLFLSYFQGGSRRQSNGKLNDEERSALRYMSGGFSSGFSHVEEGTWETRLFHVKGRRAVVVTQVELSVKSLNKGDAFILDQGRKLWVWLPPGCNHAERREGIRQAQAIRDSSRGGRAEIEILDSDWDSDKDFWALIGGTVHQVPAEGGADEDFLATTLPHVRLFRVSDSSGRMEKTLVAEGRVGLKDLDTDDAFVLDTGKALFVWIGRRCNAQERSNAMAYATDHLKAEGRPNWVPVSRELEGAETALFRQWFWDAGVFRPALLHVCDASGRMRVEEVANFTRAHLVKGDAMVLDAKETVWVWVGSGASEGEVGKASAVARHHLRVSGVPRGPSAAVRLCHDGQEPPEFRSAFPDWDAHAKGPSTAKGLADRLQNTRF